MLIKIAVLKSDISKGDKGNTQSCPIARALARELGADSVAKIGTDFATATIKGKDMRTSLPSLAKDFIKSFDEGKAVEPFEFTIALN